jgi:putative intracellular protease/amidase
LRIGVLASQGDFAAHAAMLRSLEAEPVEVRTRAELEGLDGLVIPGGESTTITKAIARDGLEAAIRTHAEAGRPILGTCAGMIVCDREHLGLVDATAERNAFGRQIARRRPPGCGPGGPGRALRVSSRADRRLANARPPDGARHRGARRARCGGEPGACRCVIRASRNWRECWFGTRSG